MVGCNVHLLNRGVEDHTLTQRSADVFGNRRMHPRTRGGNLGHAFACK